MLNSRSVIQRVADDQALATAAAGLFVRLARNAAADRGQFVVALSGGSTPKAMLDKLAEPPFRDRVPWNKVVFFWSDERAVAPDHADSNYGMAWRSLLSRVSVQSSQIHRMEAERSDLDSAALEYESRIASVTKGSNCFDLMLLGMGDDGHTASLFPGTTALRETKRLVVSNAVSKLNAQRMTMTAGLINKSACTVFLSKGKDKASTLAEVLQGPDDFDRLPSQMIRTYPGKQIWLVDRGAASQLGRVVQPQCRLAPSILAADFARLGEEVALTEQADADRVHVDVMDGHFVPNLSIGTVVVRSLRKATPLALETHLMITNPEEFVEPFAEAGSDSIIFHQEVVPDCLGLAKRIRELGMSPAISIRPQTPASALSDNVLAEMDLVLVMTVNPGFGGQKFMHEMLPKIQELRQRLDQINPTCELEVDGGIDPKTAPLVKQAGANVLVAGSAIFSSPDGHAIAMNQLRATS